MSNASVPCLTTSLLMPTTPAQKPIKVDVNLVNVAFTARDAEGALIDNLTRDDVELSEDAAPQKIEFFAKSTGLPLTLALIMDLSGSQEHFEKKHEKDLEVFLKEVLGPKDRAFMVCFGNHLRLVSDYTNSPDAILSGFREFERNLFPRLDRRKSASWAHNFFKTVQDLTKMTNSIAQTAVRVDRIRAILDTGDMIPLKPDAQNPPPLRGDITFQNVGFGYSTEAAVLRDVSFQIKAGQMVGIVGEPDWGQTVREDLKSFFPSSAAPLRR